MKHILPVILALIVGCSPKIQASTPGVNTSVPLANNLVDLANDGTVYLSYNPSLVRRNGSKVTTWIFTTSVQGPIATPSSMLFQDMDCNSGVGTIAVMVDELGRTGQPNLKFDLKIQPLFYRQAFSTICNL